MEASQWVADESAHRLRTDCARLVAHRDWRNCDWWQLTGHESVGKSSMDSMESEWLPASGNSGRAMGGGDVQDTAICDDIEGSTASSHTRSAGGYMPTENRGIAMGVGDIGGGDDIADSSAASSETDGHVLDAQQWFDGPITLDQASDQCSEEMLLAHQAGTCVPCLYFYSKLDSCRNGASCDHCHFCSPEDVKAHQRGRKKLARAERRQRAGEPRSRWRNKSAVQPPHDNELPKHVGPETWGGFDRFESDMLELIENTTHQIDKSHPKKWVCEACNETVLTAHSHSLVLFLTRQCQPGPPPWMHPSHAYTRDVGKIMCNVCFGYSNGLRAAPRLRKPCIGAPDATIS
eukprot:TRINITY_DN4015_c0_g1_i1.p1 TRINITY_DN4015_c0_g1~~TRINITY_DN4015_c0_g1_i1.p1  ORF type:complete len:348 (+),score=34.09 TRINITY_DN4015_c0_g1_i1:75-1118(+)